MKKLIPLFTVFIIVLNSYNCKAQTFEEPPRADMASEENKPLIDKIVKITNYENHFNNYCVNYITKTAKQEKWTAEKSKNVKAKINFTEFKVEKLYEWLAKYSTKELNKFIELYKKDKNSKKNNIIIDNQYIAQHLEWYAQRLIEN